MTQVSRPPKQPASAPKPDPPPRGLRRLEARFEFTSGDEGNASWSGDPGLLAALKRLLLLLLNGGSAAAPPADTSPPPADSDGATSDHAVASDHPALDAVTSSKAESEVTAVTLENATHLFFGGALYPLLRDADGARLSLPRRGGRLLLTSWGWGLSCCA